MITKAELLSLSRDELIAHAVAAGIEGPESKTRADLVDEIATATVSAMPPPKAKEPPRGFLARTRAVIARVIERGLHLPDAQLLRDVVAAAIPEKPVRAPLPTITLARIYLQQGHTARARDLAREVLALDPLDAEAKAFLETLATPSTIEPPPEGGGAGSATPPVAEIVPALEEVKATPVPEADPPAAVAAEPAEVPLPPPGSGPKPMLDDAPLPVRYGVDEAVVMVVDPTTAYLYWEVRPETIAVLRQRAPHGRLVVRLSLWADGETAYRHIYPDTDIGDTFLEHLPDGVQLRASLGLLDGQTFYAVTAGLETATPPATKTDVLTITLASWSPQATEVSRPPLPVELALSLALAHTTDASLRPQPEILEALFGPELGATLQASLHPAAGGLDEHEPASGGDVARGLERKRGSLAAVVRAGEAKGAGDADPSSFAWPLGSSDLGRPRPPRHFGSSERFLTHAS